MKNFLYLLIVILFSCNNESQTFDLSRSNIYYQERDGETGWKRVLLIKPNKWGFVNDQNKIMIPFEYDFVNPFENGLAYAKNNGKEFFITKRNLKLTGDYDEARIFTFGLAPVSKNKKWGFIDENGKLVIPMLYDSVEYFTQNGLSAVMRNGKSGFIDRNGREIIPVAYEMVKGEQLDDFVIVRKNYKWAFFSNTGKQLTDFLYTDVQRAWKGDDTTFFENGPASVKVNGKYIFLNKNLHPAFSNLSFDSATSFDSNKNAIVMKNEKFGILNNDGKLVIPIAYTAIENYNSNGDPNPNFYLLTKDKRYALFNAGLMKIAESDEEFFNITYSNQIKYISFKNFSNKYGLVDHKGKIKVPFIYDESLHFQGNAFSIVKRNDKKGIIDINNCEIVPLKFNELVQIDDEDADLFIATNQSGAFVIDLNNKIILSGEEIQSIYNQPLKFIVKRNKKYGIVDLQNKNILPFEYDEISNWTEYGPRISKFIVKNGKTGLIDENTFKITVPPTYDEFKYINGLIFAKKNNKAGIIDEKGRVICPFIYDEIFPSLLDVYDFKSDEKRIYARNGNAYFQINEKGEVLKSNITFKTVLKNTEIPEPPPPPRPVN